MKTFLLGTADGIWAAEDARCERVALEGERVTALAASPEPGALYAATAGGRVYKSRDGGNQWEKQFEARSGDRFTCIAVLPHPPYPVYAGTWPADVFRAPEGERWERVETFRKTEGSKYWCFPPPPHDPRLVSFAFHPRDPDTLYATVEMGGLMKSRDGGQTWKPMTDDVNRDTHVVIMHPEDPDTLYVSTGFASTHRPGVYWTRDGGESWEYRYRDMHPIYTWRMCIDPVRPEVLHVVAYPYVPGDWHVPMGTGGILLRTEDGGETWTLPHRGVHLPTVNYLPEDHAGPRGAGRCDPFHQPLPPALGESERRVAAQIFQLRRDDLAQRGPAVSEGPDHPQRSGWEDLGSAARGPPALPGFIAPRLTAVRRCPRRTGRTRGDDPAADRALAVSGGDGMRAEAAGGRREFLHRPDTGLDGRGRWRKARSSSGSSKTCRRPTSPIGRPRAWTSASRSRGTSPRGFS
ncbi:MAG: hypothetical protein QGF68_05910 [Nitrospinota bacterium]|nr:hypothetical protein [Nitrospinota bacterium]